MKLLDVVDQVRTLTADADYAVIDGLAQILWARKTHADDLDVGLAAADAEAAHQRVLDDAPQRWTLPEPPTAAFEQNATFMVVHLLYDGCPVDLITFADAAFTREILATAVAVEELRSIHFARPSYCW